MTVLLDNTSISLVPYAFVLLVLLVVYLSRRQPSRSYLLCLFIFGIYLLLAADQVFFPLDLSEQHRSMGGLPLASLINLIPFNFDFSFIPHIVLMQIFLNILLTVLFGFGMNFVAQVRGRRVLWVALALALAIEGIQFILSGILRISMITRAADINDVLLNALGVLIGYGIFRLFARYYLSATRRLNLRHRGLSAYIYAVVSRS